MPNEILISTPRPHAAQQAVLDAAKRFNILDIGRRWGKTKLGVLLAMETILDGDPCGYFVPTYDFGEEFWEEIKERLEPITSYKSESKHIIRTITGGSLKLWSLEKPRAGRSRKYKRVIIDEAAFAKDLKTSWEKAIRPTLADMKGDAWFLSTPDGFNYFHTLYENELKHFNWKSFKMPTSSSPYITAEELAEIKLQLDDLTWLQEFEGEFVDFTGRPFAYSFRPRDVVNLDGTVLKSHVGSCGAPTKSLPLILSFDFNLDPITCSVQQHPENREWIKIYKEFRLEDSNTYALCDAIIALYGLDDFYFKVTGDASGESGSTMVEENVNNYTIIQQKLNLELSQILLPGANPGHKENRVLTNSLFQRHDNILIDADGCPYLIDDLKFVQINDEGKIDKKKDARRTHLLDCLRYYFNTFHGDFVKLKFD